MPPEEIAPDANPATPETAAAAPKARARKSHEPGADANTPASPREIELKLELAPADWKRLSGQPFLESALAVAPRAKRLEATYFDTPDQRLRAAGVSLRVRRSGATRVQTAKLAGNASGGLFDRAEFEARVAGDAPDLAHLDGTPLEPLLAEPALRDALAPAFTVSVKRRLLHVPDDAAAMEMAVDEGVVTAGARSEPFCEIELELGAGDPAGLFRLARRIAEAVPARLGFRTKADRGYALAAGEGPQVVKRIDVSLTPETTAGAAFQTIGRACLAQLAANEAALRDLRAPGAVHQSRVALRRLRAATTLFKPVVADDARRAVSAELKWMADTLGAARDLDVYIATVVEPARAADPENADLAHVADAFAKRRDTAYASALEAASSARYRLMVIDSAAWIETGAWTRADRPEREGPVAAFAERLLKKRSKRIRRDAADLATLDPETRHEVRIEVKKLRYAVEFFESVFVAADGTANRKDAKRARKARKRHKAMLGHLEAMQEDLGALNDIVVGRRTAQGLETSSVVAGGRDAPEPNLARGLAALERPKAKQAAAVHLTAARKAYRKFVKAEPFWE